MQISNQNTYTAPASPEAYSPNPDIDQYRQEALGYAAESQPANPENTDRRRTEFGASTVAAIEAEPAPSVNETWWEEPAILAQFSKGATYFRGQALLESQAQLSQADYTKAA